MSRYDFYTAVLCGRRARMSRRQIAKSLGVERAAVSRAVRRLWAWGAR
jgi:biotin operon repressor